MSSGKCLWPYGFVDFEKCLDEVFCLFNAFFRRWKIHAFSIVLQAVALVSAIIELPEEIVTSMNLMEKVAEADMVLNLESVNERDGMDDLNGR